MQQQRLQEQLQAVYALLQQGQWQAAEQRCQQLAQQHPASADVIRLQAVIASNKGEIEYAINLLDRALESQPDHLPSLFDKGNLLMHMQQPAQALPCFNKLLAINPAIADAHYNRGNALRQLAQVEQALQSYQAALAHNPDYAEAYNNAGDMLHTLNRHHEAIEHYNRALHLKPDLIEALNGRGVAQLALGMTDQALADYDAALALDANHSFTHFNKSFCLLLTGNFTEGWAEYEWRPGKAQAEAIRGFTQPQWRGESLQGKTILLHPEQGFGDTIQFCRYAPMVSALGARVILFVQPHLKSLLGNLPGVTQVVTRDEPLPHFDYHCSYLSLPLVFKTDLNSIPADTAYVIPTDDKLSQWSARLGAKNRLRIGIVWSGSTTHSNDRNRSIPLQQFLSAIDINADIVSLQQELRPGDQSIIDKQSNLRHFGEELEDFSDTAALASHMDLVIAVDTSTAHLAGALGVPTWLLLPKFPDWRWLLEREDTPWYPSMRLFRQQATGDWQAVIERIKVELATDSAV